MEFRIKDCQLQTEEDGSLRVGGYINVTERESEMLFNKKNGKWFKEIMRKGVFKRAIDKAGKNIPLLFEHNWNKQLASIEEGSLELVEDNIGLRFNAVIKDEGIYQQVKAGIINSCSFGFRALSEEVESINSRLEKRVVDVIELLEVSLVKNPAYVGSLCETRNYEAEMLQEKNLSEEEIEQIVQEKISSGEAIVSYQVETKTSPDGATFIEYKKEIAVKGEEKSRVEESIDEDIKQVLEQEIQEEKLDALEDKAELKIQEEIVNSKRVEPIDVDSIKQIIREILAEEKRESEEVVEEEVTPEEETTEEVVTEEVVADEEATPEEDSTKEEITEEEATEEVVAEEEVKEEKQRSLEYYRLQLIKMN